MPGLLLGECQEGWVQEGKVQCRGEEVLSVYCSEKLVAVAMAKRDRL